MNNTFRNFFQRRGNRVRYMRFEDFGIFSLLRATVLNERVLFVTPDIRAVATGPAVKHEQVPSVSIQDGRHVDSDEVHGDTGLTIGLPGHHPYPTTDPFKFWD